MSATSLTEQANLFSSEVSLRTMVAEAMFALVYFFQSLRD